MSLWVISSYFNPSGYRRRRENYRVFRRRLNAPLLTVELSFTGEFELEAADAEILVQRRGGDILWQKERLLNIALEQLPAGCDAVAWVDSDVFFDTGDWPGRTLAALESFRLVQLFSERHDLGPDANEAGRGSTDNRQVSGSIARAIESGMIHPGNLPDGNCRDTLRVSIGLGWAGRVEDLKAHSFYDAAIVGGGDRAMLSAAIGAFDSAGQALRMNARRREHYARWARPFHECIAGSVGHIEGRACHLWHGDTALRRYADRDSLLADFDPSSDIAVSPTGCWRWNSEKPALHEAVRRYFDSRREDD